MILRFERDALPAFYERLAATDAVFRRLINEQGYPPVWIRPNSFATLVLIILEQQVSLASAFAAYKKLGERISITPEALLSLSDEELRSCYFSRQKIIYTRGLATAMLNKSIDLDALESMPDEEVRSSLKKLKGIGDWTVDIYLIHALRRTDVFPVGDLALVNGMRSFYNDTALDREALLRMSSAWKPYRSLATMLFWHYYIIRKNIRLPH